MQESFKIGFIQFARRAFENRSAQKKLVDVRKLTDGRREFSKVLSDPSIFANAKVTPLGFGAEWGEERWISAEILRKEGVRMPFMGQELLNSLFLRKALRDHTKLYHQYKK